VRAGLRLDMSLRRSRKRIERLMLQAGLQGVYRRRKEPRRGSAGVSQ
jgi:hypothetical protein